MRVVLLAASVWASQGLAAAPGPVMAEATTASTPPSNALAPVLPAQAEAAASLPKFGVGLDVGVPDGIGVSGIYRPFSWLRVNLGPTYNLLGFGVRGGVSLIPFKFPITPSLNAEAGHFFESDVTALAQQALPGTDLSQAGDALKHVGYDFANAQLGIEVGVPEHFIFSLRGGVSYLQTTVTGFEKAIQNAAGDTSIEAKPITVKATFPSLKLGFMLFF